MKLGVCVLLGALPAISWAYLFYRKKAGDTYLMAITFLTGGLAVFPILAYKYSWQFFPWMNAFRYAERLSNFHISLGDLAIIPMSVLATFMLVGVIEEWMKHLTVRITDDSRLKSIDDAILYSIVAALGFAFVENILYFYDIWLVHGGENLLLPFIFRSIFSSFAHVMFSGIFGYFYGVAKFTAPKTQEVIKTNRHPVLKFMHQVFRFRTAKVFFNEKILEGLIVSSVLHAVFNVALEMNMAFLILPFLTSGYLLLDFLMKRKENLKVYNLVAEEVAA
jgi:RsiW-degrading membrane proteinase PrsW (M82 family)